MCMFSKTGVLSGLVINSKGTAISGVAVSVGKNTVITIVIGYYQIKRLSPGNYVVNFAKIGYINKEEPTQIIAGANPLNVTMVKI